MMQTIIKKIFDHIHMKLFIYAHLEDWLCVEAMKQGYRNKIYNVSKFDDDIIEKDRNYNYINYGFFLFLILLDTL